MFIDAGSDRGRVRDENQDAYYVSPDNSFCVIADGMGGHNGGGTASVAAIAVIRSQLDHAEPKSAAGVKTFLYNAVKAANEVVYYMAEGAPELKGMGTTVTMCYFWKNQIFFAHVGDSRAYSITDKKIEQLTQDHTMVEMLVSEGTITEKEAKTHPQKNVIIRAVGSEKSVDIDVFSRQCIDGDIILLCSDGLTDMLSEAEIQSLIEKGASAQKLLDEANAKGGRDNITAVIIK